MRVCVCEFVRDIKEEYLNFLEKFEIEYDEKYLFDWVE